jgi:hypothetical protein
MKHYLLGALLFSLVSAGCGHHTTNTESYLDPTFSMARWKADSTGCLQYREKEKSHLATQRKFFIGKPYSFLVELLGRPSWVTTRHSPSYTIGYVINCTEIPTLETETARNSVKLYNTDYATSLVFYMRRDSCISVSLIVP